VAADGPAVAVSRAAKAVAEPGTTEKPSGGNRDYDPSASVLTRQMNS